MRVRRSLIVLTVFMVIAPVGVFVLRANPGVFMANPSGDAAAVANTRLAQYRVTAGEVALTVSAVGRVEPDETIAASFLTAGRVNDVLVNVGDRVRAGDLLATVADDLQRANLERAELSLMVAQLQKEQLLQGADETQIAIARANVDAAQGAAQAARNAVSPDDLRAAELSLQQAQSAYNEAVRVRQNSGGSPEQIALLDARVGEASFNVEIARLNLEALRTGSPSQVNAAFARVTQAQRELDRLLAGPTELQIDNADIAIARAQLGVDQALLARERTRLTAPIDGVVTVVNAERGALVGPGVTVVEIVDVDPLSVVVDVDEIDVRQVAEGMSASVRFDALPDVEVSGVIEQIALTPTTTAGIISYPVTIRLVDNTDRIRLGMTAEAFIVVEARTDVIVVPNEYIRLDRRAGTAFVNVLADNGTFSEVQVTLGLQGQNSSEITAGIRIDDILVVSLAGDAPTGFGG